MTQNLDPSIHPRKVEAIVMSPSWQPPIPDLRSRKTHHQTERFYYCAFSSVCVRYRDNCSCVPDRVDPLSRPTNSTPNHRQSPNVSPKRPNSGALDRKSVEPLSKTFHDRINLLMSRLDEQQRRWFAAIVAEQLGRGGIQQISQITGMHPDTIRRGRKELERGLVDRPQKPRSSLGRRSSESVATPNFTRNKFDLGWLRIDRLDFIYPIGKD